MDALSVFHHLVSQLDYPMFVVTAHDGHERSGCLVGFATQASIEPPRFLVLLSKANHTCRVAHRASELVVHFLTERNRELAELFGGSTGDTTDKFTRCERWPTIAGTPVLNGTGGWVGGSVVGRFDMGDHVAHLLEPRAGGIGEPARQLGYQATKNLEPGHPA